MQEKYGFVYIWRDRKKNKYYIGSHWGTENDGYICSSKSMKRSFKKRPEDFKRRVISRVFNNREELYIEENKWLGLIDPKEFDKKYYNLMNNAFATRGHLGKRHSEETKKRISEAKTKNPTKYWTGKTRSEEDKTKMRNAIRPVQTEEQKTKNSVKIKELWSDPVWREKQIAAMKRNKK